MEYVADFETTTDVNDCRVWAWAICEVSNPDNIFYGNCIETFLEFCKANQGVYYFHNLAFDGEFILHHILTNGWEYSENAGTKTYNTLISGDGKFYQMHLCFERKGKKKSVSCEIKDSLKKLPMTVDAIAKAFNLPIKKLELDYDQYRAPGHVLTPEEKDYISNDVRIVAMALKVQFDKGLTRLTVGSDALNNYMEIVGKTRWKKFFPVLDLETDAMIRRAYKGGYTYANSRFQNQIVGDGSVFDVNSLYPDVMYNRPLPVGMPLEFTGRYQDNDDYPLYIQFITCSCKLKSDHIPTLQIKNSPFYRAREYLEKTEGCVELCLTNIDLNILFEHYDVDVASYDGGYMFKQKTGLFTDYIDYWMHIKATTTGGQRQLAKLMLNSLYGKFATNPDVTPKKPYLKESGCVGYSLGEAEMRDPVYTPLGCFVTAWARYKTITAAQAVYNRFLYADTDSLHLIGTDSPNIEVHPTKLGAWKHESNFSQAKYIRAKTYMERITQVGTMVDGVYTMQDVAPYDDVKCAGMPASLKQMVTFDNFNRGLQLYGKLRPRHVNGGIVLEKTTFTLI